MSKRITEYQESIRLDAHAVDAFSEVLEEALTGINMERQNRLRIRLAVEESLLKFLDALGEGIPVVLQITNRRGRAWIRVEAEGEAFNPISAEIGDWSDGLLSSVGFVPQYSYVRGRNVVSLVLPSQRMNLAQKTILMIGVGGFLGFFMDVFLAEGTKQILTESLLQPVFQIWSEVLVTVAGPVIFLMIISTLLDTGVINRMGGNNWSVLARYLLYTVVIAAVAVVTSVMVFQPHIWFDHIDRQLLDSIVSTIVGLIPDTILEPISTANTPQILLVTFVIGTVILSVYDRVGEVVTIVKQMGIIGTEVAVLLSRLVPYVAMLFVITKMISPNPGILMGVWKPFGVALLVSLVILNVVSVWLCVSRRVAPHLLIRKLKPSFVTVLRTGRLDAAYGMTEKCCWSQLGIQKEYVTGSLPYGLVLFVPVGIAGVLIFTIYAASAQQIVLTPLWLVGVVILAIMIYEVTPPLPGVDLLTYIAIFQQMGVSESAVIAAMIFDILFWLFASASNQLLLQIELVMQAERYGLLDRKVLQKDVK